MSSKDIYILLNVVEVLKCPIISIDRPDIFKTSRDNLKMVEGNDL